LIVPAPTVRPRITTIASPARSIAGCVRALVIAAAALWPLAEARPAAAIFPGANGVVVAARCDDGVSCRTQHLWTVDPRSGARLRLAAGPDRCEDPSFSPDGTRIAFARCPVGGGCRIATVDVSDAAITDLTGEPRLGHDQSPSFSPDGSHIVFTRAERNGRHLHVMDADGHGVTRLTKGPVQDRGAVYSPDGSSIVFERYRTRSGFRLYEIPAGGGTPAPLTRGPRDYSPSISPDGTRIAFGRGGEGSGSIWIMDADGGNGHALTAGRSDARPAFSPDGRHVVFDRLGGGPAARARLMVMDATGRAERAITPRSDVFFDADWQTRQLSVARRTGRLDRGLSSYAPLREATDG
jgi:TolB protein